MLFSQINSYSFHKKATYTPLKSFAKVIITDTILLLYLCKLLIFLRCIVNKFPPIVAKDVKPALQILYSFGVFYFEVSTFSKLFQYFIFGMSLIENIKNSSTEPSIFLSKNGDPFHPNKIPHIDVVIFYTFFIFHRTEEIVKPFNHDPTLIHQQTSNHVPSDQYCVYIYIYIHFF